MKILAIETSCDDTGISILEASGDKNPNFCVLSNTIASQIKVHQKYGGVYPMMAKREHQRNLLPALIKALEESKLLKISNPKPQNLKFNQSQKLKTLNFILEREPELFKKLLLFFKKYEKPDIDLISITNGPGLEPCLWAGVNFAKALSYFWDIPIVPVNHIESHILVNFLDKPVDLSTGPAIALVVSGGHTQIILIKKIGSYKILGETRDDAAGECFDKCAKILGLGYPGGPIISNLAKKSALGPTSPKLPRPMINTKDYDFSFSGLKTAVLYSWQKIKKDPVFHSSEKNAQQQTIANMAGEIQQAIIDVLIKKTIKAAKDYNAKTIILGGGVSANTELRRQFLKNFENVIFPKPELSTDNGLMTAITGYFDRKKKVAPRKVATIKANANLRIGQ